MRHGKVFLCQGLLLACLALIVAPVAVSAAGGPVILMGIDAEDGNGATGSAHGGKAPYISVLDSFLTCVSNGGSGILVIGGGKSASDNVTGFWNAIAAGVGRTVTYVNGAASITAQSFAGFEMIAVASSQPQTFSGGLTNAENTALTGRAGDIASFVNGGGGLFGLSQQGLNAPQYGYLGTVGTFTFNFPSQYSNVTATPEGMAVGITNTNMDVCCWHDEYTAFPAFLSVLATNNSTGNPAAVGGCQVVIQPLVNLDIKPTSCPNPLNTKVFDNDTPNNAKSKKGGILPVAILGTDDLDVNDIDVSSLLLHGVAPIRHNYEDVTTPVPPNGEECECTTAGPDGYMDLTLKFRKSDIAAAIGAADDGDVIELCMTGTLLDGTEFEACDCVVIRGRKENQADPQGPGNLVAVLDWASPNPFNPVTTIRYSVEHSMHVRIQVFDIRGKLVETLVNGMQSPGSHAVEWHANGLASGVYFYRMEAGDIVQTRRMTLLK